MAIGTCSSVQRGAAAVWNVVKPSSKAEKATVVALAALTYLHPVSAACAIPMYVACRYSKAAPAAAAPVEQAAVPLRRARAEAASVEQPAIPRRRGRAEAAAAAPAIPRRKGRAVVAAAAAAAEAPRAQAAAPRAPLVALEPFVERRLVRWDPSTPLPPITSEPLAAIRAARVAPGAVPAGLANGGNTCFIAAAVQVFFAREPRMLEALRIAMRRAEGAERRALAIFENFLSNYQVLRGAVLSGADIAEMREALAILSLDLRNKGVLDPTQQEDAEEATIALMDAIIRHLSPEERARLHPKARTVAFTTLDAPRGSPADTLLGGDDRVFDAERRILVAMPAASWGHITLSLESSEESSEELEFLGLLEPLNSLPTALRSYFYPDVSRDDPVRRENAQGVRKEFPVRSRRLAFESAPERLYISFKRFERVDDELVKNGGDIGGIDQILNLPGDYFIDGRGARYRLDGIVTHEGKSSGGGHYFGHVRSNDNNGLFRVDDSVVKAVNPATFVEEAKQAYMLAFTKV